MDTYFSKLDLVLIQCLFKMFITSRVFNFFLSYDSVIRIILYGNYIMLSIHLKMYIIYKISPRSGQGDVVGRSIQSINSHGWQKKKANIH